MGKDRKTIKTIHGKPSVRVGKSGIHEGVLGEIKRRLEEEEVIKVRVLRSYLTKGGVEVSSVAEEIARLVDAEIVTVRGHVFVLRKRSRRGKEGS